MTILISKEVGKERLYNVEILNIISDHTQCIGTFMILMNFKKNLSLSLASSCVRIWVRHLQKTLQKSEIKHQLLLYSIQY